MKIKSLLFLAILSLVFGNACAGLWNPPIVDHSFEAVENGADHSTLADWGYTFDEWFENPDDTAIFWEKGSAIGLESDLDIWLGCETGGTVYQAIGTVADGVTYTVKALIGNRGGTSFGTGSFSIFAGGIEADGVDGIALDSIATLVDSANVTVAGGTLVSTNVYEVEAQLESGTGFAGQTLWLQVKSVAGKDYFDRVEITSSDMASDPVPSNGKDLVPVSQVLSWTAPTAFVPTGYYVYFSTDPNLPETAKVIDGLDVTSYDPDPDLGFVTEYFWRVDPIDPNDGNPTTVTGSKWTFTTAPAAPTITADPASVTVPAGTTAEFAVADVGGTDYTWYLVAEPDDLELGGGSPTLSIPNAQIGDEGYYYCVVSNSNGSATSATARLMVQRLVGMWKLDNDLTNEVAGGGDGTVTDPNFTAGIDGSGYQFFGDGKVVEIADSAEYYNFYPVGYSVAAWVKTAQGGWGAYVSKQSSDPQSGFILTHGGAPAVHTLRQSFNDLAGTDITDDAWHFVVGTYDAATGTGRVFVDGIQRNEAINTNPVTGGTNPLIFGAELPTGVVAYEGILDEVSVWNYPIERLDIAQMYVDYFPDAELCIEPLALDYNDNCMIDIDDFAALAAAWLECNWVPETECTN